MIGINEVKKYCRDDISKIENYQEALNSPEKWDCHHRLELTLDGEFAHSKKDLERMDMYYKRPYFELIFLKHSEHISLHHKGKTSPMKGKTSPMKGKTLSEETKKQISESMKGKNKGKIAWNKGKTFSEEHKHWLSESHKGKTHSEETKQKCREKSILQWQRRKALKISALNPDLNLF